MSWSSPTSAAAHARIGYDRMADTYATHVALELAALSVGRSLLDAFALRVQSAHDGRVADVGCGPGHVTSYLRSLGIDAFGIDASPALLAIAQTKHPGIEFCCGELASLPLGTASLGAVVAKHSIIHTPAGFVRPTLDEFARVLEPGGLLWLSFFGASHRSMHGEPFDHAVTTAYQLDVDIVGELLSEAGFAEQLRVVRQPGSSERPLPHGIFFAKRVV